MELDVRSAMVHHWHSVSSRPDTWFVLLTACHIAACLGLTNMHPCCKAHTSNGFNSRTQQVREQEGSQLPSVEFLLRWSFLYWSHLLQRLTIIIFWLLFVLSFLCIVHPFQRRLDTNYVIYYSTSLVFMSQLNYKCTSDKLREWWQNTRSPFTEMTRWYISELLSGNVNSASDFHNAQVWFQWLLKYAYTQNCNEKH